MVDVRPREFDPVMSDAVMHAPFGALGIRIDGEEVAEIVFLPKSAKLRAPRTALAEKVCEELGYYLMDASHRFAALPLKKSGTAFQQRVWRAIAAIPPGDTRRYGDLAEKLASAARAVGQACGANPFPLIVPCHRVVSATGIGGFAHASGGYRLAAKRWLLAHEAADRER